MSIPEGNSDVRCSMYKDRAWAEASLASKIVP